MNATDMNIKDRVFLITGGTSGVGNATAMGLARLGAKVVIVSRSEKRGQQTLAEIAQVTGNDQGDVLVADLALQASIKSACETFKRKYDHLHVLANLGGAVYTEKQITSEGIERMFAVNYLGHFVLTMQLLDMLKTSRPARVITVLGAPRFLKNPQINLDDLQLEQNFNGLRVLAQGLFARAYFTFELAKRLEGTGVTAVAFHPGWVRSQLTQNLPRYLHMLSSATNIFAKADCEIGVYLAAAKAVEGISGVYFDDKKQIVPIQQHYDAETGRRLWDISERLAVGVSV
jgi:NAD(P)-dependent dehydrogenase (short-subunit alcohol dehydrogenase family)